MVEMIKEKLMVLFNISEEQINTLNGYQNQVFLVNINNKEYIIRVTDSLRRNKKQIEDEIYYVNYLNNMDIPVAQALRIKNEWVKEISIDNKVFYVMMFEKIDGKNWNECKQNHETFFEAGKILGKIHQASKALKKHIERPHWDKNNYLEIANDVIPNQEIVEYLEEFKKELNGLPKDHEGYGLVHGDFSYGNIIYKTHKDLTVIDFDESEYSWFAYDIAVYLFYYLLGGNPANMEKEPNVELFKYFMKGYLEETDIDEYWIEKLPLFFRLREYILLSSIYRSFYPDRMGPWQNAYVDVTINRIKQNKPFIDIDYKKIFNEIKKERN